MKRCCNCKQDLPETAFYKNKPRKDGLSTACGKCLKLKASRWQKDFPERARLRGLKYRSRNLEKCRLQNRLANKRHLARCLANTRLYEARKLQAAPKWLTAEHKSWIRQWYTIAKWFEAQLGGKWHVDHMVPLKGRNVSGLHVPWNLQLLPATLNLRKNNKWE